MKIRSDQLTTFAQETSTRRSQSLPDEIENDLKSKGFETSRDSATGDLWIQDRRGYASRLAFKDNRPGSFSTPSGLRTSFHFDPEGNLRSITDPAGRRADFTYDSAARITSIQSAGREWLVAYAPGGSLKSLRFPDGRSWHLESDSDGSVWRWTDRSGAVTTYEISDDGLVETMRDPLGRKTTFQANEPVSIQAIRYPDGAHELSALDVETGRRVVTRRDGSEYREFFTADGSSRIVNWPDCAPLTFSFDRSTGASSVTDGESQVAYFRSPEGAEYERTDSGQACCEYDPDGRLALICAPGAQPVEYRYDPDGRIETLKAWGRECRFHYSSSGEMDRISYPSGLTRALSYSPTGALASSVTASAGGSVASSQSYQYDIMDQLTSLTDTVGSLVSSRTFEYDAELRLTSDMDSVQSSLSSSFSYDRKGNMIADGAVRIQIGELDEPRRYGTKEVKTDRLGNIAELPAPRGALECDWSSDGMLRKAICVANGVPSETSFEYDPIGRRIGKQSSRTVWRFGWSGRNMMWESHFQGGEWRRRDYAYLPNAEFPFAFCEDGRVYWCEQDVRGATTRVYDDSGELVWAAVYASFGDATVIVDRVRQPWRLCGLYLDDETGLCYTLHRYYSPTIKSFLSRDPLWAEPRGMTYAYCSNRPWLEIDPLGAQPFFIAFLLSFFLYYFFRIIMRELPLWAGRRVSSTLEDCVPQRTTLRRCITTARTSCTAYMLGLPAAGATFFLSRAATFVASPAVQPHSRLRYITWLPYVLTPAAALFLDHNGAFCNFVGESSYRTVLQCSLSEPPTINRIIVRIGCQIAISGGWFVFRGLIHAVFRRVGPTGFYVPHVAGPGGGPGVIGPGPYLANTVAAYGLPPGAVTSFQAQHIIPKGNAGPGHVFMGHPLLVAIGFSFAHPFDTIFLPTRHGHPAGTPYSNRLWIDRLFTIHQGYHGDYSLMIWRMLNVVHRSYQVHRMRGLAEFELYHLLRALRFMQEEGTPIYPQDGVAAEVRMWTMAMIWWLSPD